MSQKQADKYNNNTIVRKGPCTLLCDLQLLAIPQADISADFLESRLLQQATSTQRIAEGGRGQAWFVEFNGLSAVYRKYLRGGLIARLVKQTYFSLCAENTRSIKEWRLLQWMLEQGLTVPKPVAASVCRWPFSFSPLYRAQILVQRIPNVQTLDQLLMQRELTQAQWQSIGECIRKFHNAGIYHADLNANNILLDADGQVYLIDFDKGELRAEHDDSSVWKAENLQRLKRSLLKQQAVHSNYFFMQENWQLLLEAYR